jgi:hypothetical protein
MLATLSELWGVLPRLSRNRRGCGGWANCAWTTRQSAQLSGTGCGLCGVHLIALSFNLFDVRRLNNKYLNLDLLAMAHPIAISCISSKWRTSVIQALIESEEIDLIHFLFQSDVEFCEDLASKYSMDFTSSPKGRVAFFRKRPVGSENLVSHRNR